MSASGIVSPSDNHTSPFATNEEGEADHAPETPQGTTRKLLNLVLQRRRTKVIFIVGLLRCGKSSLFEALTGTTGYSGDGIDSVTKEYHLGCGRIGGEFYVFVDTPGFDDPRTTNEEIFRNIISCIQSIQDYVIFTGILYVHKLDSAYSAGQSIFIEWLQAICGPAYLQHVTFVTTKWDEIAPKVMQAKVKFLEEWTEKWSVFLENGAKVYHHGKKYSAAGFDLGIVLDATDDKKERSKQARLMISRHYKGKASLHPRLVIELKRGLLAEDTTAGRVLRLEKPASIAASPVRGPDWSEMFTELLLWPLKRLMAFAQALKKVLPSATWRQRVRRRGLEVIFTMPSGTEIAVGWGRRGWYTNCPPDDSDAESDDLEFANAFDGEEGNLFAGLGDNPDEAEFADAVRRTMAESSTGCVVM